MRKADLYQLSLKLASCIPAVSIIKKNTDASQRLQPQPGNRFVFQIDNMRQAIQQKVPALLDTSLHQPALTMIMPFEPKMTAKSDIAEMFRVAKAKVTAILLNHHSGDLLELMLQKLESIFANLNLSTHKKSIAICFSPVFEKVFYLDIPVQKTVFVKEGFHIRDLVKNKATSRDFLVLVLSSRQSKVLLGNDRSLKTIVANSSRSVFAVAGHSHERVGNFADPSSEKESTLHKFLHYVDHNLDLILKAYPFPLFIVANDRVAGHFKTLTKHASNIIDYIHGNYDESSTEELAKVLEGSIDQWDNVARRDLLKQIDNAKSQHRFVSGIRDVWKESMKRNGRLLLIARDYLNGLQDGDLSTIFMPARRYDKFSCIQNTIDEIIAVVLENGGDVTFTDDKMLAPYEQIALIKHY